MTILAMTPGGGDAAGMTATCRRVYTMTNVGHRNTPESPDANPTTAKCNSYLPLVKSRIYPIVADQVRVLQAMLRFAWYAPLGRSLKMKHSLTVLLTILVLCGPSVAQEKKGKGLRLKDLPAAVQKTVGDNLKGGEIKTIGKEKEAGIEQYEVESLLNGKSRDFNVDAKGNLLLVEEASSIDAIPGPAKASILKKVASGKLGKVETFTKPGQPMMYEAAYADKKGKHHEVLVKADGTETKE
jgi:hypothetical protein